MPGTFQFASVIVSTYNRPDALRMILLAFEDQTDRDFEVVIAADGSTDETRRVIDEARRFARYPLKHVWQEDRGWRISRAHNLAALQATGDYYIFVDGDCLPVPRFVADHRWLAEPGWWVRGTRAYLSRELTAKALANQVKIWRWPLARWLAIRSNRQVRDPLPLVRLRVGLFRKRQPRKWEGAITGNLGVWAEDYHRIDGSDEIYKGWGRDDSDLVVRLIRAGVYRKEGRFAAPVIHLWHPESDRSRLNENERLLQETLQADRITARVGLSSHGSGQL